MRKSTKVLIVVLVIIIISLIGYITYIFIEDKKIEEKQGENEVKQEEQIENNEIENNEIEKDESQTYNTTSNTNIINENAEQTTNQTNITPPGTELPTEIVGQEEQESSQENGGVNPEEKAINLAKQKWGETSDSYTFMIDHIDGNVYHVAVVANAITIAYIDVNIQTGEVNEF